MDTFEVGPRYLHVVIALGVLATTTVALRLFARWMSKGQFGADDCWVLVGLVFVYGLIVNSGFLFIEGGDGRDFHLVTATQYAIFYKSFFASSILYFGAMTATKISILCLYRRVFTTPGFQAATIVVGSICVAWFISGILAFFFQCSPVAAAWTPNMPGSHCISGDKLYNGFVGSNLITDVIILCLPMKLIWNLQLCIRQKLVLLGIFSMGGLVCVVCLLRIITFDKVPTVVDLSRTILDCSLWTVVEPVTALTCANLFVLRPLIPKRAMLDRLSSRFSTNISTRKSWYGISNGSSGISNVTPPVPDHQITGYQQIKEKAETGRTSRIERGSREMYTDPHDLGIYVREEVSIV